MHKKKIKQIDYCKCNRGSMTQLFMSFSISGKHINLSFTSLNIHD